MFTEKLRAYRAQSAAKRKIPVYRSTMPRFKGNQNAILTVTFVVVLLGIANISSVRAESMANEDLGTTYAQSAPSGQGAQPGRPPREAIDACSNVKPQSACAFPARDGDTIQGTCLSPKGDGPLACVPANMVKKG